MLDEPTDVNAKARVLYGAHLAACSLAVAGTGLHHKICHVLGGALNADAETHAIVLPQVVAYQQGVMPERSPASVTLCRAMIPLASCID